MVLAHKPKAKKAKTARKEGKAVTVRVISGDCREVLPTLEAESVHCVVTSPPYWGLRDYGVARQIGLEANPEQHLQVLVEVFREVRRVMRSDATLWLNIGDCYGSGTRASRDYSKTTKHGYWNNPASDRRIPSPAKQLMMMPARLALALQADGWWLRRDIIWAKPNPMPESVSDRCTTAHEYLFHFAKNARYHFDADAIAEPIETDPKENYPKRARITGRGDQGFALARGNDRGKSGDFPPKGSMRNKRSVWTIPTLPFREAHFATFPPALVEPCILAGCPEGGITLDPFGGSGTVGLVADRLGRDAILIELNPAYAEMARRRIQRDAPLLARMAGCRDPLAG